MEKELMERFEAAVVRLEAAVAGGSIGVVSREVDFTGDSPAVTDPAILAFDEVLGGALKRLVDAAEKIGGKVLESTKILQEAFLMQKELLIKAKQSQKPEMAGLQDFLQPLNDVLIKANALTEGRRPDYFNHLKTVADSLSALAWIAFLGKDLGMSFPTAHVEESWQMAEFYNNKVLVEYRNKDPDHVEWAKALKELYIPSLRDYVKKNYPLGPTWGPAGSIAPAAQPKPVGSKPGPAAQPKPVGSKPGPAAQPKPVGSKPGQAGPPPPPAPSKPLFSESEKKGSGSKPKVGMSAVFDEISTKPVTAGLRKVTDDMKTKNRSDRTGVVNIPTEKEKTSVKSSSFSFKTGPPKMELQMGRKWVVENQVGKKSLSIDDCDSKQSVYIYGCKDSVIQVKGKVNNITLDKCTKTGVVFTDVVAACEVVNCSSVEVQCQGSAPTISIDNTSGCQLYLSKDSLGTSVTTAKSSEINVLVPGSGPDSDLVEHPLPQQYIHSFKDGHFTTLPVAHSAG